MHDVVLYPQNGDRIVTTDSVTSLHPVYCNSQSVQRYLVPYDRVSCTYGLLRNVRMAPLLGVGCRHARGVYRVPVIKDDVGQPQLVGRHVEPLHSAVLGGIPRQTVIVPRLRTHAHTHTPSLRHVQDTVGTYRNVGHLPPPNTSPENYHRERLCAGRLKNNNNNNNGPEESQWPGT